MKRLDFRDIGDKQKFDLEYDLSNLDLAKDIKRLTLDFMLHFIEQEVTELCGEKYERGSGFSRWGFNPGSIAVEDMKLKIQVPRVIDKASGQCYKLKSYNQLKEHVSFEESIYKKVLHGISTREYSKVITTIVNQFGYSKSSVSRKFLISAEKRLKEFNTRSLSDLDLVAIFIDGKRFSSSGLIIALGVDLRGEKHYLGFIESSTENSLVMSDFFEELEQRGLSKKHELLFVVDGAKGISKGIRSHFGKRAFIQRCQWHKRRNVISYLPKKHQDSFRIKIQRAYEKSTYKEAKDALLKVEKELKLINQSAANSLKEGLEETLMLHKLNLFDELGRSFKTTNVLEAVNRQVQKYSVKVTRWRSSKQIQYRVAAILLETERNLTKVCGHEYMSELREQMKRSLTKQVAA